MPGAELTNGGDCHPFITFEALAVTASVIQDCMVCPYNGYCLESVLPIGTSVTWFLVFRASV
ncbi:MAG: hypothetical protein ACLR7D_11340 [Lachnospira eligens]